MAYANNTRVGWFDSGDYRGTTDILYPSITVIILCVWISTYPNVPSPRDRFYHGLIDKVNLAMIGFLGPDLLFALALGQWSSARRSVKEFRRIVPDKSDTHWSITHGFYADMGGFRVISNQEEPGVCADGGVPVNAQQLLYLIENNHIDIPSLRAKDIKAMSTSDIFSKILVLWQAFWFIVTEVTRFASDLPITTLELTAFIFAIMMLATSIAWFQKPQVTVSTMIKLRDGASFQDIRDAAKLSTHPHMQDRWYDTPLDFIWKRTSFELDKQWQYFSYLSHLSYMPLFTRLPKTQPRMAWDRMPSDIWYQPRGFLIPLGLMVQIPFCLSFLSAWEFHFVTRTEQVLWRVCALCHAIYSLVITSYYVLGVGEKPGWYTVRTLSKKLYASRSQSSTEDLQLLTVVTSQSGTSSQAMDPENGSAPGIAKVGRNPVMDLKRWRNLSPDLDPDQEVSLRWTICLFSLTLVYIFSHLYFYLEDIVSLRSQPIDIYFANATSFPLLN